PLLASPPIAASSPLSRRTVGSAGAVLRFRGASAARARSASRRSFSATGPRASPSTARVALAALGPPRTAAATGPTARPAGPGPVAERPPSAGVTARPSLVTVAVALVPVAPAACVLAHRSPPPVQDIVARPDIGELLGHWL